MTTRMPSDVEVFAALADDTRWTILQRIGREGASASTLASELPVTRQAIVRHLSVLENAGLAESERFGRERRYTALGVRLSEVGRLLESVGKGWEARMSTIKAAAERDASH
ncbi:ArsR/SmtB family transcription factor [Paramicrobacterium fandaimingii]|uniref:ArsR/SmtB family transcription factor n=1 Tax=Paramicrobacterium fandaimingii TaxID=2708079 RepID=UPI001FD46334|nr:metalloregulator ArsR/SmtB family transcription factor [Microbacterium fandaimingii]